MLGKKVKDNSIDEAPEYAPNFTESEGNGDQNAIGRHHQDCAQQVNDKEYDDQFGCLMSILFHEVLNFVCVEIFDRTNHQEYSSDNDDSHNIDAKSVGVCCGIE